MVIKDKTELNGFNSMRLPKLKGKVKITLHNCKTGKNEIVEGENIVTNAVRDIYLNNVMGGVDYSKTMPLWSNWFGGVLAFENAFTVDQQTGNPDPNDYYIQGNDVNECVAHAGGTVIPTDHDDDLLRGSPTTSAFVKTISSIKQVWEWLPSHGNSGKPISALALTHKDTGDAGTGSTYYAFQNFSPFDFIQGTQLPNSSIATVADDNLLTQYDDNHGLWFHIGDSTQYADHRQDSFETKKLTIEIRNLPYAKAGLFETFHARSDNPRRFTVETTGANMYLQPAYYFDYANKYLWLFYNNTSVINVTTSSHWGTGDYDKDDISYFVVDCVNETIVDEGTIHSDTNDIMPLSLMKITGTGNTDHSQFITQIIKDGNYVYFPTGYVNDQYSWSAVSKFITTGYKKINISNQSEQTSLAFSSNQDSLRPVRKCGNLIVNSGRIINGGTAYPCVSQFPNSYTTVFQRTDIPSSLVLPIGTGEIVGNYARYIVAPKLLMTTKWNLPTPVQKTASQAMAIEYELEEV